MILRSCRNRNHILYIYVPFGCAFSIALKHANKHQQYSLTGRLRISHSAGHPAIPKHHPPMLKVIHPFSRSSSHPKVASTHAEDHPPMLKVIQPSLSIIRPFSGHPTIQKYHPPMLKVIQPPLSIIHPFSRSSTHSAGHPHIQQVIQRSQSIIHPFSISFRNSSIISYTLSKVIQNLLDHLATSKPKSSFQGCLKNSIFWGSVCPPNFTISGILLLWILLLWNVWRILGKHTVCTIDIQYTHK